MKNFTTLKNYKKLSEDQKNQLALVYQAILDGNIYAKIESVSRSGLSRRISFYMVEPGQPNNPYFSNPHITRVTNEIAWLTGWIPCGEFKSYGKYMSDHGLKVDGVGMDMIFHTLYTALGYPEAKEWNQQYRTL